MAGKGTNDMNEGIAIFEEYANFCDDEATEKGYAIKDSEDQTEELAATFADSQPPAMLRSRS